jgi:hypothetical protein
VRGLQKVARPLPGLRVGAPRFLVLPVGKAEDRQAPLARARARRRHVVEEQLFAQYGVGRFRQGRALALAQAPVVAKKARDHGIGRVLESKGQPHELCAGVDQGVGMHRPIVPFAAALAAAKTYPPAQWRPTAAPQAEAYP